MSKRQPRTSTTKTYVRKGITVVKSDTHGTPGKYSRKMNKLAKAFALLGLPEEDIAKHLEIEVATFIAWKKEHPSFLKALIDGGEKADAYVAKSLYRRALGLTYNETTTRREGRKTIITTTEKTVPADIRAAEIWLRNRTAARKRWSSRPEEDLPPPSTPTININTIDLSSIGEDTIRKLLKSAKPGQSPKS